mmetsp:Transcript_119443/g.338000  ORF Transcript_119443/g.338000 Transcript_119443/m.338000 type:complete len:224 (-) Transcript_119443:344-1015(-)
MQHAVGADDAPVRLARLQLDTLRTVLPLQGAAQKVNSARANASLDQAAEEYVVHRLVHVFKQSHGTIHVSLPRRRLKVLQQDGARDGTRPDAARRHVIDDLPHGPAALLGRGVEELVEGRGARFNARGLHVAEYVAHLGHVAELQVHPHGPAIGGSVRDAAGHSVCQHALHCRDVAITRAHVQEHVVVDSRHIWRLLQYCERALEAAAGHALLELRHPRGRGA